VAGAATFGPGVLERAHDLGHEARLVDGARRVELLREHERGRRVDRLLLARYARPRRNTASRTA